MITKLHANNFERNNNLSASVKFIFMNYHKFVVFCRENHFSTLLTWCCPAIYLALSPVLTTYCLQVRSTVICLQKEFKNSLRRIWSHWWWQCCHTLFKTVNLTSISTIYWSTHQQNGKPKYAQNQEQINLLLVIRNEFNLTTVWRAWWENFAACDHISCHRRVCVGCPGNGSRGKRLSSTLLWVLIISTSVTLQSTCYILMSLWNKTNHSRTLDCVKNLNQ